MRITDKYTEDAKRCQEIGTLVSQVFSSSGLSREVVVDYYTKVSGLGKRTALRKVQRLFQYGPDPRAISNAGSTHGRAVDNRPEHLNHIAQIYHFLGVPSDDQIVDLTREVNPAFEYPPINDSEVTIPHDGAINLLGCGLTPEQIGNVQRLVEHYVTLNLRE